MPPDLEKIHLSKLNDFEVSLLILRRNVCQYEAAYKPNNIPEKFEQAYNILRNANATIQSRYTGAGYSCSYWLYGPDKIYRQKLKTKKP